MSGSNYWKNVKIVYDFREHNSIRPNEKLSIEGLKIVDIVENAEDNLISPEHFRYFKEPSCSEYPLILNKGLKNYQNRNWNLPQLHAIENYFMTKNIREFESTSVADKICTHRNMLHTIMSSPYNKKRNWSIKATKFNNIIYMLRNTNGRNSKDHSKDTWHFKFEQYCFSDTFDGKPNTDVPVHEDKRLHCVFSGHLKNIDLLYSSEVVGGVMPNKEIKDLRDFDEVNKCQFIFTKIMTNKQMDTYLTAPKMRKCWLQAYLSNTSDIFIGFFDEFGMVRERGKSIQTKDLPEAWNLDVCLDFLFTVLNTITIEMSNEDCPDTIYEFTYHGTRKFLSLKVHKDATAQSFLTKKFVQHMNAKLENDILK